MGNALLNFAVIHGVTITQKYFTRGNSQMECDPVHSCIERKLKNKFTCPVIGCEQQKGQERNQNIMKSSS